MTESSESGGWDELDYEDTVPANTARQTGADRGIRLRILLVDPPRRPPGQGRRCSDCGGSFERVTLVRSGAWSGSLCGLCLVEARQWGAQVEELAAG